MKQKQDAASGGLRQLSGRTICARSVCDRAKSQGAVARRLHFKASGEVLRLSATEKRSTGPQRRMPACRGRIEGAGDG